MSALFALAAAIGWGGSDFAAGSASRRSRAESVVLATHLIALLVLLPVAALFGTLTQPDIVWGVVAGLAGAGGSFMLYRGLGRGLMAVVAPVTAAGAAAIPAVFGLLRGDTISKTDILGIVAALVAIVLMSLTAPGDSEPDVSGVAADDPSHPLPPPNFDARAAAPASPSPTVERQPSATAADTEALVWRKPWLVPALVAAAVVFAAATAATPAITALLTDAPLPPGGLMTLVFAMGTLLIALTGVGVMMPVMRPPETARPSQASTPDVAAAAPSGGFTSFRQAGLLDAILSGLGFGLFFVALSQTSTEGGMWPLVAARGTSVIIFAAVCAIAGFALVPAAGARGTMLVAGVGDGCAALCFLLAAQSGQLAIAAVLSSLYPGVTVLLARVMIGERCRRIQTIGLGVAGAAVVLLAIA